MISKMFLLAAVSSGGSPSLANTTAEAPVENSLVKIDFEPKNIKKGIEIIPELSDEVAASLANTTEGASRDFFGQSNSFEPR